MARLPQPGADNGTWGDILNDYLSQTHKADGTLKDNTVTNAAIADNAVNATSIADGSITETLLDTTVQTKLNQTAPTWSTLSGKPAVIAAGADAAGARTAIGAVGSADLPVVPIQPGITLSELNNIFSNNNGVIVQAKPGEYLGLDGVITMKAKQSLIGDGAVFKSDSMQLRSYGSSSGNLPSSGAITLTNNQTAGSFRIDLPTGEGAGFAENDVVYIRADNDVSYDAWSDAWAKPTELHQVLSVSGDTLHLSKALVHDYATVSNARVVKVPMNSGVTVKGITFTNATLAPFVRTEVIDFRQMLGCDIDVTCINAGQVRVQDVVGGRVKGHFETQKPWDTQLGTPLGYGVYIVGQGFGTEVFVSGWGCRHIFTTHGGGAGTTTRTGPYSTTIRGSGMAGAQYEAHSVFDTHSHAYDTTFVGCVAWAGDNDMTGSRRDNAAFADRAHRTTFINCRGTGHYTGLRVNGQSTDTKVIGGHFTATSPTDGVGILVYGKNVNIIGSYLDAPMPVRIEDELGEIPAGTVVKGSYLRSTIAAIRDLSNSGSGDADAIAEGNMYEINNGVGFDGFVGRIDGLTLAPSSSGTMSNLLTGIGATSGPQRLFGSGSPEGSVAATVGSTYVRTDGGIGTTLYVKESGAGDTGWVDTKTLTSPVVNEILDNSGNELLRFESTANAVNQVSIKNNQSGSAPQIKAEGDNTNIGLNLVTKGTGLLFWNSVQVPSISNAVTLSNKTLATPKIEGGSNTATISAGTGSPEGVVTATVGSLFLRTDGTAGTTLYVKETGAGNTGWVAK